MAHSPNTPSCRRTYPSRRSRPGQQSLKKNRPLRRSTVKLHERLRWRAENLDETLIEWVEGPDFDGLLVDTVTSTFPQHEQEHFVAHYRGLLAAWAKDQRAAA